MPGQGSHPSTPGATGTAGGPGGLTRLSPRSVVVWTAVSVVGAVGWAVLALARGESVSAAWMLAAALGSYAIAYRFYAKFIVTRVLRADATRATPAERL